MRLISKFKDGYDIYARNLALSDQSWNRAWRREMIRKVNPLAYPEKCDFGFGKIPIGREETVSFTIFFCGIEIPVIMVQTYSYDMAEYKRYCFYNFKDFHGSPFYRDSRYEKGLREYFDVANRGWRSKSDNGRLLKRLSPKEINLYFKSPVVIMGTIPYPINNHFDFIGEGDAGFDPIVYLNPCLNDFQFFSEYMDAFVAFRELERFISNDLVVPDMKDVKISDVLKAETHGFDKHSFRKDKATS